MKAVWKILAWTLGLVVVGIVGLATLWTAMISVGYLNLTMNLWSLQEEAELAMALPVEPGETVVASTEDGQLVVQQDRRMAWGGVVITRKADGDRFLTFDRGGGHLGNQGYVYAPYAEDSDQVHQDAFGSFEGRDVSFLYGSWYSYDSTED